MLAILYRAQSKSERDNLELSDVGFNVMCSHTRGEWRFFTVALAGTTKAATTTRAPSKGQSTAATGPARVAVQLPNGGGRSVVRSDKFLVLFKDDRTLSEH